MDWKSFFDRLGMNGTKWQWRIMQWERRRNERREQEHSRRPQISERHKFCTQCGALLERDDQECIRCGARAQSWQGQKLRRKIAFAVPERGPVTLGLLAVILTLGITQLVPVVYGLLGYSGFWSLSFFLLEGDWWRLLSYAVLHGGLMHLAFNSIALWQVGSMLEDEIGPSRYFTVFLFTCISAALLFSLFSPAGRLVGASGGLFGLIGFGISHGHFYGGPSGIAKRNFFAQWALYGLIFGLMMPGVANTAHLGGFLLGLALGFVIERDQRKGARFDAAWNIIASIGALVLMAALGMMLINCWIIYRSGAV